MRVLVLGAAVSGSAAARLAARLGHEVLVHDRDETAVARLGDGGWESASGSWAERHLDGVDVVVTSPGIPEHAPPLRDAARRGLRVWSEMEFAARHLGVPYVAVTGTNGKTTTTLAATEMLAEGGVATSAAGNVGTALSDVVGSNAAVVVVEASSFQLRFIESFHPVAAAVLNVAPDHLDWHGSYEAYRAAKARIFENQTAADLLVYDCDDPGATSLVRGAAAQLGPISAQRARAGGSGRNGNRLTIAGSEFDAPVLPDAFLVDLTAAACIALHAGASPDGVARTLETFAPPLHRRTVVGEWGGVIWIDDSKATNPHAAVAAASSYPSVVLIAGGRNKGLELRPLAEVPTLKALIGMGEASRELEQAASTVSFSAAAGLEEAVRIADGVASAGDVVLLAPGCASFDMFDSYEDRGRRFVSAVRRLKEPAVADSAEREEL